MSEDIIIWGDVHCGVRGGSVQHATYQIKCANEMVDYAVANNIKTILQLGDLFDVRKATDHRVLDMWKRYFFNRLEYFDINLITLLGNHDLFYKTTLEVNSQTLMLSEYDNITTIDTPTNFRFGKFSFLVCPWIIDYSEYQDKIKNSKADFFAGHMEFAGFEMHKGMPANHGIESNDFGHFKTVFTGHYHTQNKKNNIFYIGNASELSWMEAGDAKGFHVFDSESGKTKFIENSTTIFNKIEYNDKEDIIHQKDLKDTYVKVIVINKTDPKKFDSFIDKIQNQVPLDLKIVDIENNFEIDDEDSLDFANTKSLIGSYVDNVETTLKKDKIKSMLQSLYVSSLEA